MKLLQRIVVGVDGSASSDDAIALGVRLARSHGGGLLFCHSTYARDGSIEILEKALAAAADANVFATTALLEGLPEYAIVQYASDSAADAIVVGTHGKTHPQRFSLGSTAEGILRIATSPVFVAHGPSIMTARTFDRILVAIDDSEPSEGAIEFATALAAADGGQLVFCHVIDEETLFEEAVGFRRDTYAVMHEWLTEANALTKAAVAQAQGGTIPSVDTSVVVGKPIDEILNVASLEHTDLIVVGAHGRRGVQSMLMGSVTKGIVRRSAVPVGVVRTSATARKREEAVLALSV